MNLAFQTVYRVKALEKVFLKCYGGKRRNRKGERYETGH